MTRSIWKGPFSELLHKKKANIPQKIWSRRSTILPKNIDDRFFIYNGKIFISVKISEDMVGHKFGEFAATRRKPIHKSSRKKRK
jgi:small subunit ribosomal protein S19|nr:ribosomal protein S19 [Trebouxia sp. A1-2]